MQMRSILTSLLIGAMLWGTRVQAQQTHIVLIDMNHPECYNPNYREIASGDVVRFETVGCLLSVCLIPATIHKVSGPAGSAPWDFTVPAPTWLANGVYEITLTVPGTYRYRADDNYLLIYESYQGVPPTNGTIVVGPAAPQLTIGNENPVQYCAQTGGSGTVDYTTGSPPMGGNVFTVQLSDANGSFAAPTNIGALASTNAQGTINYTIPAGLPTGTYAIRVLGSNPSLTSNTRNITLVAPVAGTITADPPSLCSGGGSVNLLLQGHNGSIQWQVSTTGGESFTDIPGATNQVYITSQLNQTTIYRAVVTLPGCGTATTEPVTILVNSAPAPGTATANQTSFCSPSSANLTLTGYSPGTAIQWQTSSDGQNFSNVTGGGDGPNYTTPVLNATRHYRAMVSVPGCDPAYSNVVTINIGLGVQCSVAPALPVPGQNVTFFVYIPQNGTPPFNIVFNPGGGQAPQDFNNITDFNYSFSYAYGIPGNYSYQITVNDQSGCTGTCGGLLNVSSDNPSNSITAVLLNPSTVCPGANAELTFVATGTFTPSNVYEAQLSDATGSFANPVAIGQLAGNALSGTISLTVPSSLTPGNYRVRIFSAEQGLFSNEINLNIVAFNVSCSVDTDELTASLTVSASAGQAPYRTEFYPFEGSQAVVNDNFNPLNPIVYTYAADGTYSYRLVVRWGECSDECTGTITVESSSEPTYFIDLISLSSNSLCSGETVEAKFSSSSNFGQNNIFVLQRSDVSGSFANPVSLASLASTGGNELGVSFEVGQDWANAAYRFRVVAETPAIVSDTLTAAKVRTPTVTCSQTFGGAPNKFAFTFATTNVTPPYTLVFDPGDESAPTSVTAQGQSISLTHTYRQIGTYDYRVRVENAEGCADSCAGTIVVSEVVSRSSPELSKVKIYPNPSGGKLKWETERPVSLELTDLAGKILWRASATTGGEHDFADRPAGVYLLKVRAENTEETRRWVKH